MNTQIQNQESMLKESVKHFLTSYQSGSSDFSSFESIFFRLIQTMLDPPLEITWFYSAVTFHAAKSGRQTKPSDRVLIAKDLLNLLTSCSNLSSASKKIALLAPVVYELYSVVCDCRKSDLCEQMRVGELVENMVSYVMMSAGVYDYGNEDVECDNVVVCFEDLIRVWITDRGGGSCSFGESLRIFFPLLTDETWNGMHIRCGIQELVGIVLCEVFFLRLFLSFSSGLSAKDCLKDTRDQAVETIKGFRNCFFLDMLLKMLLEPSLPVAASLSSEDAVLLRKVLFDAVILIDYSFYSGRWVESSVSHSKKLALLWVLAVDHAINFARVTADETRAVSYLNAFHESQLVAELIKWVQNQAGTMNQNVRYDINTPRSLIYWLLVLEDQGIPIFDPSMAMLHTKAMNTVDLNKMADQEMFDQSSNGVPGYNCLTNTGKKRREAFSSMHESQVKQIKLVPFGNSVGEKFPCDGMPHHERVVIDISSDDEMEL